MFKIALGIMFLVLTLLPNRSVAGGHGPHWSYDGEAGPEHWGELSHDYAACKTGKMQSPIDLKWSKTKGQGKITFDYHAAPLAVIDNGHTIQVNFKPGSSATIRGKKFDLVQMHFHTASEHTISGKSFPMELHFVHKNKAGKLAVVGVMFREGSPNAMVDAIWKNLPGEKGKEVTVSSVMVQPADFLPTKKSYYHYQGSLTTPPCSEGVNWNVLNTPVEMSADQIQKFREMYANNARPVQQLFGRKPANY